MNIRDDLKVLRARYNRMQVQCLLTRCMFHPITQNIIFSVIGDREKQNIIFSVIGDREKQRIVVRMTKEELASVIEILEMML